MLDLCPTWISMSDTVEMGEDVKEDQGNRRRKLFWHMYLSNFKIRQNAVLPWHSVFSVGDDLKDFRWVEVINSKVDTKLRKMGTMVSEGSESLECDTGGGFAGLLAKAKDFQFGHRLGQVSDDIVVYRRRATTSTREYEVEFLQLCERKERTAIWPPCG